MQELLDLANGVPTLDLDAGATLLRDGDDGGSLYVLLDGALVVEKSGMSIATIDERGSCVGEMSVVLGRPSSADVRAAVPSTVAVVADARARLATDPELALALARLLASRLQLMTSYLADLKQQYGDHEGGLGMVDTVLSALSRASGTRSELSSDRDPDPEY
ncbi:MAG TPA: cyclic nucleotide-binding domain-containing protein [Acidimicrobiia bacterium]|nr:cyclic nucleotide-binding domain-containing protein [Acidimicrobiia bacterium]